jgi:hypothetical protein
MEAVHDAIKRGKAIMEEVLFNSGENAAVPTIEIEQHADRYKTKEFMKLKQIPSRDNISRRASFIDKVLEDSVELRTPSGKSPSRRSIFYFGHLRSSLLSNVDCSRNITSTPVEHCSNS